MRKLLRTKWTSGLFVAWAFTTVLAICPYICSTAQADASTTSTQHPCHGHDSDQAPSDNQSKGTHPCCEGSLNILTKAESSKADYYASSLKLSPVLSMSYNALSDNSPNRLISLDSLAVSTPKMPLRVVNCVFLI